MSPIRSLLVVVLLLCQHHGQPCGGDFGGGGVLATSNNDKNEVTISTATKKQQQRSYDCRLIQVEFMPLANVHGHTKDNNNNNENHFFTTEMMTITKDSHYNSGSSLSLIDTDENGQQTRSKHDIPQWRCLPVVSKGGRDASLISYDLVFENPQMIPFAVGDESDDDDVHDNSRLKVVSGQTIVKITQDNDNSILNLPTGTDQNQVITVSSKARMSIMSTTTNSRQLTSSSSSVTPTPVTGKRRVLLVRIKDSVGNAPTKSSKELSNNFFGPKRVDKYNVRRIYDSCSGGQVRFRPVKDFEPLGIQDGIMEWTLQRRSNMAGRLATRVERWIDDELDVLLSGVKFDHIVYIFPESVDFDGAAGYAYIHGNKSVLWNRYASFVLVQVHELGHNLGMYHSGGGTSEYGDGTCWMGAAVSYEDESPKGMCFNAAKSWYLGWYNSYQMELVSSGMLGWKGQLVGIHDWKRNKLVQGQHFVILKVFNFYIMWNLAKGSTTRGIEHEVNHVVIASTFDSFEVAPQSWLVGSITDSSGERRVQFSIDSQRTLTMEVCRYDFSSVPEIAHVVVVIHSSQHNDQEEEWLVSC